MSELFEALQSAEVNPNPLLDANWKTRVMDAMRSDLGPYWDASQVDPANPILFLYFTLYSDTLGVAAGEYNNMDAARWRVQANLQAKLNQPRNPLERTIINTVLTAYVS